ncbi:hypothetical protein [Segetibacter koreensis]|uniref:hypothetical protein n=1 Tax=Segetibacter koreensis TaxID=398037 RepID=UPI00036C7892|nr:hypothetical protein [Segetibacter koreensis]
MKEHSLERKSSLSHENERRDLVNLDFYNNEIMIMQHNLDEVAITSASPEIKKKVEHLKHQLNHQEQNLAEFRKNFDLDEIVLTGKQDRKNKNETNGIKNGENFFQHLQSFEDNFKDIRQEVLEFINNQVAKGE